MLPSASDLIKWIVFTNEERTVLLEAFHAFFPVPEPAPSPAPAPEDDDEDYSARRDLQTDELKLESLRSSRSRLLASLRKGPNVVLSLSTLDCEALSALVMLEIAGFYDYLMSVEASFAALGFKLGPINDDRQTARFRILNKLSTC